MRAILPTAAAALVLAVAPAHAAFHLWKVDEVFSSADGSVQFVELSNASNNEQFISSHQVRVRAGATVIDSFTFPADLPTAQTANRTLLLATPGFAAVAGVFPDYEIAEGFIDLELATVVAFDALDAMPIAGLPRDGRSSLHRNAGGSPVVADATPRNFAGSQGAIDLPEPRSGPAGLLAAGLVGWLGRRRRGSPAQVLPRADSSQEPRMILRTARLDSLPPVLAFAAGWTSGDDMRALGAITGGRLRRHGAGAALFALALEARRRRAGGVRTARPIGVQSVGGP